MTHTRDIWDNHLPRFIRFQALEVIFRNACKTKKYQYALECFEIYKRNRDKKKEKEKENDYTKFLKKRLFPLYVRLAYATSSVPPEETYHNFTHLLKRVPDDLSQAQSLCLSFTECSGCIFKLHKKDYSNLIEQMISQCACMPFIEQTFKDDQLMQLYCTLGRYHVLHNNFDKAQQALAEADALQKKCKTNTTAPLIVRTELIISQAAAAGIALSASDIEPLIKQLTPYISRHEGIRIATTRLLMAATKYQDALDVLKSHENVQTLSQRLLGKCLMNCMDFKQANELYCRLKKIAKSPDDLPLILWEHAICNSAWAQMPSGDSELKRTLLEAAFKSIIESISLRPTPHFWKTMGHICDLIHSSSLLSFDTYKELLEPNSLKYQGWRATHSWNNAASQAYTIASKMSAPLDEALSEPPNVFLPLSSFTVNEV